ncbi:MAG TPA: hypothetical protein VLZ06_07565 [Solirubrobacteraceae bacterium]|nr:hypothetical protein [Solirubrobacteraceae bacterium]
MEFALILRELWARKRLLALGILVAGLVSLLSVYRIDGFGLKRRTLQYSSASTILLVDTPTSVLGDLKSEFVPLINRAQVYANFLASPGVLDLIARHAGLKGDELYASGPVEPLEPRTVQEPTATKRNVEITGEATPYRLSFTDSPSSPSIGVFTQAPTTATAEKLANAAGAGLEQYVEKVQAEQKVPRPARVVVRQLGAAHGGVVDGGFSRSLAALVFLGVLFLWCVMMIAVERFRRNWRSSAEVAASAAEPALVGVDVTPVSVDVTPVNGAERNGTDPNGHPAVAEDLAERYPGVKPRVVVEAGATTEVDHEDVGESRVTKE